MAFDISNTHASSSDTTNSNIKQQNECKNPNEIKAKNNSERALKNQMNEISQDANTSSDINIDMNLNKSSDINESINKENDEKLNEDFLGNRTVFNSNDNLQSVLQTQIHFKQDLIDALVKRTGYPIVQENGQRKYGPPPDWNSNDPEPDRGCEVFVGKIPRDCFEDEIIPLLERIGRIYEFRLMMEYSGYNRGYAFVMYTSREDAKKAVQELNNFEIRKGRMIGVCRSVDNCRLFVGGIPKNKRREEILEEMRKVTEDVVNVIVYPSAHDKTKNRGFAFVQYTNHRAAAIARRKLIPARIQLFGQPIAVDWAEPEPEVDESVMATVKVLYVRNLMLTTTEEQIKNEFEKLKEGSIERVKKMKDFAFVHFKEREDAVNAMKAMNGSIIDGSIIEVSLSKPIDKNNLRFNPPSPSPTNSLIANVLASSASNGLNLLLSTQSLNLNKTHLMPGLIDVPFLPPSQPPIQFTQMIPYNHQSPNGANNFQYSLTANSQPTAYLPFQNDTSAMVKPYPNILAANNSSDASLSPNSTQSNQTSSTSSNSSPSLLNNQTVLTSKPSKVMKVSSSASASSNGRNLYRSTYYNLVKAGSFGVGNANSIKKQVSSQDSSYDLYNGLKPIPILPYNNNNTHSLNYLNKTPVQILEEICFKDGLPTPVYSLHTTNGHDVEGREVTLYMYKIMIPGLFNGNQLSPNKLSTSSEEAKNEAAGYLLSQLYPQSAIDVNEMYKYQASQFSQQHNNHQNIYQNSNTPNNANTASPQITLNSNAQSYIAPAATTQHTQISQQQNFNNPNDGNNLFNGVASLPPQQVPNRPPHEYISALVGPQFIIDPSGQYIICPSTGW